MTISNKLVVGVLALQGAFIEHINHFENAINNNPSHEFEFEFIEVRNEQDLQKCHSLVIPGGESTSISLIAERTGLLQPLYDFVNSNKPIWGTCAGLIFLSKQILNGKPGQKLLGGIDIEVKRNAFGRQLDSFETNLDFSSFIEEVTDFPTIFIRAPVVSKILTSNDTIEIKADKLDHNISNEVIYSNNNHVNDKPVQILHQLDNGLLVAVKQGNTLGTSFHPELSSDYRFHNWFLHEFVIKYYRSH